MSEQVPAASIETGQPIDTRLNPLTGRQLLDYLMINGKVTAFCTMNGCHGAMVHVQGDTAECLDAIMEAGVLGQLKAMVRELIQTSEGLRVALRNAEAELESASKTIEQLSEENAKLRGDAHGDADLDAAVKEVCHADH